MLSYLAALVLLGIGWNFGFIGATNMLTLAMTPSERPVAQGVNDTVVALASTLSAFASGALVTGFGWTILAIAALPILCVGILLSLQSPAPGRA